MNEPSFSREPIYSALFSLLQRIPGVQTTSRKLKHWADVEDFPAIFQNQKSELAAKSGRGVQTVWTLSCDIYVYVRVSADRLTSTELNEVLDHIQGALAAPEPISNKQTLGGLVEDCWINGQIITDEGALGEIGVAIIPVQIIVS